MKFTYKAKTQSGDLQVGTIDAGNEQLALDALRRYNLIVVSLEAQKKDLLSVSFLQHVSLKDLAVMSRQFSAMMEAKIDLPTIFNTLSQQTTNGALRECLREILSDVQGGLSLSQALGKHTDIFSEFYINMVRSGEVGGRLEETMAYLADYLEGEANLVTKVRDAFIYPVFILVVFGIAVGLIVAMVIPSLKAVFTEGNVQLPALTSFVLSLGDFLFQWGWLVILSLAGLAIFFIRYIHTEEGSAIFDTIKLKIPIIGGMYRKFYIARFADATSVLIRGGIPVVQAFDISAYVVSNYPYRLALRNVAEGVKRGEFVSELLASRPDLFPPLVSQMVAIGERTGRIDDLLSRVAKFYNQEVTGIVNSLTELIQPILILVLGVLVGGLMASILLPIYSLVKLF
ncbi:MAG: type II secretion system F family protein [Patescibacteria group bacterium]|nr:type II secretion system F family protein [Patescibacteria group bacterium]MDE2438111.1 type II secretion system F family protein [Patescibacteria group bacterium]